MAGKIFAMQFMAFRRALVIGAVTLSACGSQIFAQTTPDQLEAALKGKRFALRNFSADPDSRYRWLNGSLIFDPPKLSTLAIFQPGSVKFRDPVLTISGIRATLILDGEKASLAGSAPMNLRIDLGSASVADVLPNLQSALFFPDLKRALDSIPAPLKARLPYQRDKAKQPKNEAVWFIENDTWNSLPGDSKRFKGPEMPKDPKIDSSEQALNARGEIVVAFTVSEKGRVSSPWLLDPVGVRLYELFVESMSRVVFEPAQLDGHNVGAEEFWIDHLGVSDCVNCQESRSDPSNPFPK